MTQSTTDGIGLYKSHPINEYGMPAMPAGYLCPVHPCGPT
uniref:Uncharacterized protein n=1 Tax=Picea glauca TaxID=3330 RepID=A0A101LVZ8_PICGL|nr:hypothetical protein ABT39_MTgene1851 [Picea glauca]